MNAQSRLRYPSDKRIKAAVASARDAGLDVAAIEVAPDGAIRILSSAAFPSLSPRDEFEKWQDQM